MSVHPVEARPSLQQTHSDTLHKSTTVLIDAPSLGRLSVLQEAGTCQEGKVSRPVLTVDEMQIFAADNGYRPLVVRGFVGIIERANFRQQYSGQLPERANPYPAIDARLVSAFRHPFDDPDQEPAMVDIDQLRTVFPDMLNSGSGYYAIDPLMHGLFAKLFEAYPAEAALSPEF
jgi:hypothetical protein